MRSSFHFTESCAKIFNKNLRKDISPTRNINMFIFSKGDLELLNKHFMDV